MLRELILRNRSYRRFRQDQRLSEETLRQWVDMARLGPSGANLQPLKYKLTTDEAECARVFGTLAWAGYLTEWSGPEEGQRPAAYITILNDTRIAKGPGCDQGIAAQNILLAATEAGYGGCMIGSIQREALRSVLGISDHLDIVLVAALGKPAEKVVLEDAPQDGSIKYYRDSADTHHVPKRRLDDIIV